MARVMREWAKMTTASHERLEIPPGAILATNGQPVRLTWHRFRQLTWTLNSIALSTSLNPELRCWWSFNNHRFYTMSTLDNFGTLTHATLTQLRTVPASLDMTWLLSNRLQIPLRIKGHVIRPADLLYGVDIRSRYMPKVIYRRVVPSITNPSSSFGPWLHWMILFIANCGWLALPITHSSRDVSRQADQEDNVH